MRRVFIIIIIIIIIIIWEWAAIYANRYWM
jgi:hypothetical protein